jgi:hypothetical protein
MGSSAPGPTARNRDGAAARGALLADFSLDITAKELSELGPARAVIPAGTPVQLAFPDGADLAERASTARAIKEAGFTPVPIIAARRLRSRQMLREYLAALRAAGASESVLVVAGDPVQPQGPYPDATSVIGSGLLEEHGVRQASAAWVDAGRHAPDAQNFWLSVVAALRATGPGSELVRAVSAAPDLDGWALVERLLDDLAPLGERLWLVVDDVHELDADQGLRQLELLLMRAPLSGRGTAGRAPARLGRPRCRAPAGSAARTPGTDAGPGNRRKPPSPPPPAPGTCRPTRPGSRGLGDACSPSRIRR